MIQLVPMLSTISRPVYQDRDGSLFLKKCCAECGGEGQYEVAADFQPDGFTKWETCEECRGDGEIYEETSEDELNPSEEN